MAWESEEEGKVGRKDSGVQLEEWVGVEVGGQVEEVVEVGLSGYVPLLKAEITGTESTLSMTGELSSGSALITTCREIMTGKGRRAKDLPTPACMNLRVLFCNRLFS